MKRIFLALFLGGLFVSGIAQAGYKIKPFSAGHAKMFAAHDFHDNITIAAEPYDQPSRVLEVFDRDPGRVNYVTVLIVISNDSDDEIEVDSRGIELTRLHGIELRTTPADQVVRDIFYSKKRPESSAPRIGIGIGRGGNTNKDFENARVDFLSKELGDKFIPAHSTEYGFVFFETPQLGGALVGSKVYVPKVIIRRAKDPRQMGRELMFYEIDLKPAIVNNR